MAIKFFFLELIKICSFGIKPDLMIDIPRKKLSNFSQTKN